VSQLTAPLCTRRRQRGSTAVMPRVAPARARQRCASDALCVCGELFCHGAFSRRVCRSECRAPLWWRRPPPKSPSLPPSTSRTHRHKLKARKHRSCATSATNNSPADKSRKTTLKQRHRRGAHPHNHPHAMDRVLLRLAGPRRRLLHQSQTARPRRNDDPRHAQRNRQPHRLADRGASDCRRMHAVAMRLSHCRTVRAE
jgi:hypothetical protein